MLNRLKYIVKQLYNCQNTKVFILENIFQFQKYYKSEYQ